MHLTAPEVISLIIQYKYLILFPLFVFEGPVATIISGFLATPEMHYLNIVPLFIIVLAADLTGDLFYYSVGRWGRGTTFFNWVERKLHVTAERFQKLEDHFQNHGGMTIAIAKISHGVGWPVVLAAGATRMNLTRFLLVAFSVSIFKSAALIFLGYFYGESYEALSRYIHYGGLIFSAVLVSAIILYFILKRRRVS